MNTSPIMNICYNYRIVDCCKCDTFRYHGKKRFF